jgi:hypothetical protein
VKTGDVEQAASPDANKMVPPTAPRERAVIVVLGGRRGLMSTRYA